MDTEKEKVMTDETGYISTEEIHAELVEENKKKEEKQSLPKKILKIVGEVVFWLYMVFMVGFAISNVVASKNNGIPNVFGTGYLNVLTDSMIGNNPDSFNPGDLIVVNVTKNGTNDISEGDIVCFYKDINNDGKVDIVAHRVRKVTKFPDGNNEYALVGDKAWAMFGETYESMPGNQVDWVFGSDILGVYKKKTEKFGSVIGWCQGRVGFFIIVVLPTILFLIYELMVFIRTYVEVKSDDAKKKQKESNEELLAKEREEMKKQLLEELKKEELKKQLLEELKQEEAAKQADSEDK